MTFASVFAPHPFEAKSNRGDQSTDKPGTLRLTVYCTRDTYCQATCCHCVLLVKTQSERTGKPRSTGGSTGGLFIPSSYWTTC